MKKGKKICETLKAIRSEIASANDIDYSPAECHHEGDCAGTCPKCESETRWLERQLRVRQALGKAVTIAGLSLALGTMTSCEHKKNHKYDRESSESSCSAETSTSYEDVDGYFDDSDTCFTSLNDTKEFFSTKNEKDEEDEEDKPVLMGEVAIDEDGNTYGP